MSAIKSLILKNTYRDSVFLMKISSQASQLTGVELASAMMATERNKDLFRTAGLFTEEVAQAKPDDLVVCIKGEEEDLEKASEEVKVMLQNQLKAKTAVGKETVTTIKQAVENNPQLNMALISVAGDYAKYEAAKAINQGLNVMLYSDNISIPDEVSLKKAAAARGLFVMGPDCGTAILQGVPLAFANIVRKGNIGIVGASGTGIQEVTCIIDALGSGISQAFGTGGRDMKDEVGGITAFSALKALEEDENTKVLVVISKPPGKDVRRRLCDFYTRSKKPIVVYYAGNDDYSQELEAGAVIAMTLEQAATKAVNLLSEDSSTIIEISDEKAYNAFMSKALEAIGPGRSFVRGVFGGGSLCYEAMHIVRQYIGGEIFSNTPIAGAIKLPDSNKSIKNTFVDLGEDEFTVGKPHPMIDPAMKMNRIIQEILDETVAIVLTDLVLGNGTHPDPSGELVKAINKAETLSKGESKKVSIIASVCGTEADVPSRSEQITKLLSAGVIVMPTNALAARIAGECIHKLEGVRSNESGSIAG